MSSGKSGIFLNYAATAPVGRRVIERMSAEVQRMGEPLGRHFYQSLGMVEETRRYLAELIHAHPCEIALTGSTSISLSLVALAVGFREGDRVLFPSDEFPSNRYVWQNLQTQGVLAETFELERDVPLVETLSRLNINGARLISVSSVSYRTGRRHDVAAFSKFCRERGILSCVDAIQEVGAAPVDARASGVDFLACGAQKWLLGPIGVGFLFARRELLDGLRVPLVGWTSSKFPEDYGIQELQFSPEMTRFEAGLPNLLPIAGLHEALRERRELGSETVFSGIAKNRDYLAGKIEGMGLRLMATPHERTAGIVSFELPRTINVRVLGERLQKADITITVRENYMRVSPHFGSTIQEMDGFLDFISSEFGKSHSRAELPKAAPSPSLQGLARRALVLGPTGSLGEQIVRQAFVRGFDLVLASRKVNEHARLIQSVSPLRGDGRIESRELDLTSKASIDAFLGELAREGTRFSAVINCAGSVDPDLFVEISDQKLDEMAQVGFLGPARIFRAFLKELRSPDAHGILNIVSSSGRCGYPLLSGYGAASGALWTLSESLERELNSDGLTVTTYVAPAMHSKMQKTMGRTALRYFKLSGKFDYEHTDRIARDAMDAFLSKRGVVVHRMNRLKLLVNTLTPRTMSGRIAKVFRV